MCRRRRTFTPIDAIELDIEPGASVTTASISSNSIFEVRVGDNAISSLGRDHAELVSQALRQEIAAISHSTRVIVQWGWDQDNNTATTSTPSVQVQRS